VCCRASTRMWDGAHEIVQPETQLGRFSPSLATIKSLPGWCDGLRTVGVVNLAG